MKKLSFLLIIGLLFSFSSCEDLNSVQVTGIDQVKIESSNKSEAKLTVFTKIDNPSNVKIKVKNVSVDMYYGDLMIGKIADETGFELQSNAHQAYPIPVTIDVQQLLKNKKQLLATLLKEGTKIRFVGTIRVSGMLLSREIRVNHTANLNIIDSLLN